MKLIRYILFLIITLIPMIVFASGDTSSVNIISALLTHVFISIHASVFMLLPLSQLVGPINGKSSFWKLFWIRVMILIFLDLISPEFAIVVDIISIFVGGFVLLPLSSAKGKVKTVRTSTPISTPTNNSNSINLKCAKCGNTLLVTDKFCINCGAPFDGNNVVVSLDPNQAVNNTVLPSAFDAMYALPEDTLIETFIKKEMAKAKFDMNTKLLPMDIVKRKQILNIIFSVLVFVYISLIFFHFPFYTYLIGLIILVIYAFLSHRMNMMKYLVKQVKARPSEKISNIVMSVKENLTTDSSHISLIVGLIAGILLPLTIFFEPHIIYESTSNGYAVRFYTFGLTNFKEATIPEIHNKKPVVSLRGNAFSNMPFLKKVTLPDTIVEIRGEAFANDRNLKEVNIPEHLEYLGGSAFYNCTSLEKVKLPNSLTYLGGEAFYNCTALKDIELSNNIEEIRGNTFENCYRLEKINIPDKVVRIGGHAFYGCSSLSEVTISENSSLKEIGSSAFRQCSNLKTIFIPRSTQVNSRAFKESPTTIHRYGEEIYTDTNYPFDY